VLMHECVGVFVCSLKILSVICRFKILFSLSCINSYNRIEAA
jgi:hypothetical protein